MRKITLSISVSLFVFINSKNFTTPNTRVIWTLDDIALASPTTVTATGSNYSLLGNLIVSENYMLLINSYLTLFIGAGICITIFGVFTVNCNVPTFTAISDISPDSYRDFYL